ncbi:hypothetical protein Ddye_002105 [Dipteronia dyeriana]|uniref:Uncharacterized protein n=1 Tax=Dipteronia dyeriana TaxID=168575 RepID=A0AAD9XQD9_9ROSI|nr:hypothetical protein Ddye_002105 [Dipteronia dyeriana]
MSNKTTLHLVYLMDNCTWKLRAVRRDKGAYFQVRSFVNEHTCPLENIHRRHRQASAVIIGEVVAPRLQQQDSRLMRPKDIIDEMKTMYGIQILYSKAHQALQYALSLTYGTHEETFKLLPSFGYVLEQQNPGTITNIHCNEDGRFLYFFHVVGCLTHRILEVYASSYCWRWYPFKGKIRGHNVCCNCTIWKRTGVSNCFWVR